MASYRRYLEPALALWLVSAAARAEPPPVSLAEDTPRAARDDAATLHVSGLLQIDGVLLDQTSVDELDPATREPLNRERVTVQRAWLRADAGYKYVHGLVLLEGSTSPQPSLRLLAAELSVFYPASGQAPLIELTAGLFLIPFGFETRERVDQRMFLEASTWVEALFPGRRDLGLRARGQWRFLRYALAVMNGDPIGSASLPLRDLNRAKDIVGRLGAEDALAPWLRASVGVSALLGRGLHPGVAPSKDTFTVRDENEDGLAQPGEIQFVAGEPGEPSRNFDRRALAADLAFAFALPLLGAGKLYGELIYAVNLDRRLFVADPIATGRDARELGVMAALRQALTRHAELGLRYDRYEPDRDASSRRGTRVVPYDASFETYGIALAWCTLPQLRVTMQYDHRSNPLGRDRRGAPSTLAADSLVLRAQLEL
jgi:hypothetical protein